MARLPGQSQLDWLWDNYGERPVATDSVDDPLAIPSYELVKKLVDNIASSGVGSIKLCRNELILTAVDGTELERIKLHGLTKIRDFGRRLITVEDKKAGCKYDLYTPVYYIKLDNEREFLTPVEIYTGGDSELISNSVQNNKIFSTLKLSQNEDNGILLKAEPDGLSGQVLLDGTTTGIKFAYVTERVYNSLPEVKENTIYFIKDRPYFFFNEFLFGGIDDKEILCKVKDKVKELVKKEKERASEAEEELRKAIEFNTKAISNKQEAGNYVEQKDLNGYVSVEEYNTLKEELTSLRKWAEGMFKSDVDTIADIKKGGEFTLVKNIKAEKDITLTKNTDLDLDGHELSAVGGTYGDNVVIGNGANVIIKNGEIKPADKASLGDQSATIIVKTAYESHLTLENTKVTGIYPIYLNSANTDTTVTINGGEYYSSYADNPAVYVGKGGSTSTIGGKVTINGGTFGQRGVNSPYLLNVEDILRKQEGKEPRDFIEVFGGTFINFNPANNKAEGEGTNFVAEGHTVKITNENDDVIYEVV